MRQYPPEMAGFHLDKEHEGVIKQMKRRLGKYFRGLQAWKLDSQKGYIQTNIGVRMWGNGDELGFSCYLKK